MSARPAGTAHEGGRPSARLLAVTWATIGLATMAAGSAPPDRWTGRTLHGWDREQGNWISVVANPGGIDGLKEDQRCAMGHTFTEKVLMSLGSGWYLVVVVENGRRQLSRGERLCPPGTLSVAVAAALEDLESAERERQATAMAGSQARADAARRKALIRQYVNEHRPPF